EPDTGTTRSSCSIPTRRTRYRAFPTNSWQRSWNFRWSRSAGRTRPTRGRRNSRGGPSSPTRRSGPPPSGGTSRRSRPRPGVQGVIDETARANAKFALVSSLPGAIPIIGSLMAAGADMLILTKNQVVMVFKIAAIHDRDIHDQWQILREITPVVGAGFFWRT